MPGGKKIRLAHAEPLLDEDASRRAIERVIVSPSAKRGKNDTDSRMHIVPVDEAA